MQLSCKAKTQYVEYTLRQFNMAADMTTFEFQEHSVSLESKMPDNIFFPTYANYVQLMHF
jgi:hypothetical protein